MGGKRRPPSATSTENESGGVGEPKKRRSWSTLNKNPRGLNSRELKGGGTTEEDKSDERNTHNVRGIRYNAMGPLGKGEK